MYPQFSAMLKDLRIRLPAQHFHYLVSCLNSEAPPDGTAVYITSEEPTKEQTGNAEDMRKQVEKFASSSKESLATFVIGHSYGGWLAMYMGENLRLGHSIDGIFTVDPISPECDPSGFIFGAAACHQAPTDLDNKAIQKSTNLWMNYYQDQDAWLHASSIPEAQNVHFQYRGQHTQIDIDPRLWSSINEKVKAALSN